MVQHASFVLSRGAASYNGTPIIISPLMDLVH